MTEEYNRKIECRDCDNIFQWTNKSMRELKELTITNCMKVIDNSCDDDWYETEDIYGGDLDLNEVVDKVKEHIKQKLMESIK